MNKIAKTPFEALEIVFDLIGFIQKEEGSKIALMIAEEVLEKLGVSDLEAKEMLAIRLMEICFQMEYRLKQAFVEQEIWKDKLFIWDWIFLKYLMSIGENGRGLAEQIMVRIRGNSFYYERDKNTNRLLKYWFNNGSFCSPVFLILGEALWLDLIKNAWMRKKKMFRPCQKESGFLRSNLF